MTTKTKLCPNCEERQTSPGSGWCSTCALRKRKAINGDAVALAKEQPCVDCGLVEPDIVEFDHVPERGPKLFGVARSVWNRGLGTFQRELEKCDIVCPNCHARRTNARKNLGQH